MSNQTRRRGPMGHGHMGGEKAKDFKGAMKQLIAYMMRYKFRILFMFIFAIGSTIFTIIGPKILGNATTEIFTGLTAKIQGTGGIDFDKIVRILLTLLALYGCSALFGYIQGFIMTHVSNDAVYNLRKERI